MKSHLKKLLPACMCMLASCTSLSVDKTGANDYVASGRNAAGMFVNYPKLRAAVKAEADRFATERGMRAIESGHSERNRFIPGFPYYEYKFELQKP
jgi:hypothetical protein